MPQFTSICTLCSRLNPESNTCAAFPKGIPPRILKGEVLHLRPVDGDRGQTFELRETDRQLAEDMVEAEILPPSVLTAGT